ncbi:hypothetical protein V494_08199 [Pseudogymnoascus sp. VKM F-4513 (FW-928)]|nr:hypothetical protein V494_08199 [Pseudogymnoascus sp. VKM F-4513 (FW-928)]
MVGTQKWSMEEILWVITMVRQGLKDEEIYEKFCGMFRSVRHVRGPNSIKYCRTGFMKQEEYSQEKYWEDVPGKIGFILGRHDAGVHHAQIAAEVIRHFPTHIWAPHVKPPARCIEFVVTKYRKLQNKFPDYTRENPLVEPVISLTKDGVLPEEIFKTANENGIGLDDVYYIMARFGLEVEVRPTAWELSNYGQHPGASSAGPSTSQAGPSNTKAGPLIFQLPPSDANKRSKAHGSQYTSYPSSDTGSRLPHHGHGYDHINRAGNQMSYHGAQSGLEESLLNGGYPQGISSEALSQVQLHNSQSRPQPGLFRPSQHNRMEFQYPNIPQNGQVQHLMSQQPFGHRSFEEYPGEYPNSTIQPTLPGQFQQQNWGNNPTFGGQQVAPEQLQDSLTGHQQTVGSPEQRNYGSSSQPGLGSYQPQPRHHLRQAFTLLPPEILVSEHQQPVLPITGYENIDPALLRMDTNQQSRPAAGIMTLSHPPLTPRITPQDYLHPFAYSGVQNGQDISPLTMEAPQLPVPLPPSPEVTHDGFQHHRGQSTIPGPFAQESILSKQPRLGFGADLHDSSGTSGFDQDTFDHSLPLSNNTNVTNHGHESSRESEKHMLDAPDQCGGEYKTDGEGSNTDQASPNVDEAVEYDDLFKLFLDLDSQGCNFNFDGSTIGSGATDPFENDLLKNSPEAHGPQEMQVHDTKSSLKAMETLSRNLETEMAGPFLTQNSVQQNNDSGGIQHSNSGVSKEDSHAPEGTCCTQHQDFECFFEIPDSEGESATV